MSKSVCRFLLLASLVAVGGCTRWAPKTWVEEQRELQIPAAGVARLEVETHNGALSATGAEAAGEIRVVAKVRGGGASEESAQACLEAIELVSVTEGSVHRLGWRYKHRKASDWESEVAFRMTVPPAVELAAKTHNGSIEVIGMNGACGLVTHNGPVRVDAGAGPLDAETHNGSMVIRTRALQLDLTTHNGEVKVEALGAGPLGGQVVTHNGRVRVGLADGIATDLTCDTGNGTIDVDVPWQSSDTHRSHAAGRVGAGGASLKVETHNGTIDVRRIQAEAG